MKGQPPTVTVLMPVRNAAATVQEAVQSILRQTFPDWELLLIDDGSTDDTIERVHAVARKDPRIRIVPNPGRGIVSALNYGLALAQGEFVARMDADDVALPERLELQVDWLRKRPEVGVVGSLVRYVGDPRRCLGLALYVAWNNRLIQWEQIWRERFIESPLVHPSVLFRKDLVQRFGGYAEGDFPEDYELWLRWIAAGVRMEKVPRNLLLWRDLTDRLSRRDPRYRSEAFYALKARYLAPVLLQAVRAGRVIWIWGASRFARHRARWLETYGVPIQGYIDIDPCKIGQLVHGRPVLAPQDLPPKERCVVVSYVASRGARSEIRAFLTARGWMEGRDFWMAA